MTAVPVVDANNTATWEVASQRRYLGSCQPSTPPVTYRCVNNTALVTPTLPNTPTHTHGSGLVLLQVAAG
jgi:hypothetical protein